MIGGMRHGPKKYDQWCLVPAQPDDPLVLGPSPQPIVPAQGTAPRWRPGLLEAHLTSSI
jgi:hypothetical protein